MSKQLKKAGHLIDRIFGGFILGCMGFIIGIGVSLFTEFSMLSVAIPFAVLFAILGAAFPKPILLVSSFVAFWPD